MRSPLTVLALLACVPAASALTDHLVGPGGFATISQAMGAAVPGDRILVQPGTYPAFHLSKGVSVIGMGADPTEVSVGRVDVHVTIPVPGYDALLSNMSFGDGAPENLLAITGNEQPPGTLVVSGVNVHGAVFLGGGANGFHAHFQNTSVEAGPGQGFLGAAVYLGGTAGFSAEFVNSTIQAWDASSPGPAAGIGLRLAGGMRARLTNTVVRGGDGVVGAAGGGAGITSGLPAGGAWLRLQGGTFVQGGDAATGGTGGTGIALSGTLELGLASVAGGAGAPAGPAYSGIAPQNLPMDPHLVLAPAGFGGSTPVGIEAGDTFSLTVNTTAPTAILIAPQLNVPPPGPIQPLAPALVFWVGSSLFADIPATTGLTDGVFLFAQAFTKLPGSGPPPIPSNVQAIRFDLGP